MKIALVHDYLTQFGGGERVLSALCEMFPEAPIFTLIYDERTTAGAFKNKKIHTSFLQKIPGAKKFFRGFIWLMPLAVEQFDLSDFDIVISVSHSFGKGVITKPGTKHICYCLTPTRYLWHDAGLPFKLISRFLLSYLRIWDFQAAQRIDYFIADSENVRQRIKKYYNRESTVIYPPIDINRLKIENSLKIAKLKIENYFLMVGRMVPYKRFDLAVEAFGRPEMSDKELLIIGDGPEYRKLKAKSEKLKANNVKFLRWVSDSELPNYYADCRALIFPQEEDFGIVAVEAMALGKPVIAFRAGGTLETMIEGKTGVFFDQQTVESLIEAVKNFDEEKFNPEKIRKRAQNFDQEIFKKKIQRFIHDLMDLM